MPFTRLGWTAAKTFAGIAMFNRIDAGPETMTKGRFVPAPNRPFARAMNRRRANAVAFGDGLLRHPRGPHGANLIVGREFSGHAASSDWSSACIQPIKRSYVRTVKPAPFRMRRKNVLSLKARSAMVSSVRPRASHTACAILIRLLRSCFSIISQHTDFYADRNPQNTNIYAWEFFFLEGIPAAWKS